MSHPAPNPLPLALLGMTWGMLFWGAALGSIPVIIHLLHKRKYRETSWAAMRFLMEAARKHSRRLRLEQLLLLLIRVLILLFLVAGLKGMYTTSTSSYTAAAGPTHHILVLDASFSMQREQPAGCTAFVRAKQAALNVVDSANDGDLFQLALITGTSDRAVVKRATRSKKDFRSVLGTVSAARPEKPGTAAAGKGSCEQLMQSGLQPSDEFGRLGQTLRTVGGMLKDVENVPSKRIYFVSDFQKATWQPDSPALREKIHTAFKAIGERASLVLIDVGHEAAPNTAVIDLGTDQPFVIAGRRLQLKATLHNFGPTRAADRTIRLLVDGVERDAKTVTLEANSGRQVDFEYPPRDAVNAAEAAPPLAPGEHVFEVRLQDDALAVDNVRRLSLPVKEQLKVLLVNGRPAAREQDEATYYVKQALRPSTKTQQWKGIIRPRVIAPAELLSADLSDVDCLFLCNVPTLKTNEARKLESYVDGGGGLVICLGDQVDLPSYNETLYRDGSGVMPARLLAVVGSDYHRLDTSQLSHPIVEPFVGNPGSGLEVVFTRHYVRAALPEEGGGRVVLRFQRMQASRQGDPAVIAARVGLGNVVLLTTAVETYSRWTLWPINLSFVPLMNEIVHFCVAGNWRDRQKQVGEAITRGFATTISAEASRVPVAAPDGTTHTVSLFGRDRWIVRSGGARYFERPPGESRSTRSEPDAGSVRVADRTENGRIPAGRVLLRQDQKGDFVSVLYEQRPVWIEKSRLRRASSAMLYFDGTARSGVYEVKLRPPLGRPELYAVNVDPAESDLSKLDEKALRNDVLQKVPFLYRTNWQGEIRTEQVAASRQDPLTRWFLIAVLCLLAVELLMAWRFQAGLLLLGLLLAAECTRLTFAAGPAAGLSTGLVLFGAIAGAVFWLRRRQRRSLSPQQAQSGEWRVKG